MDSPPLATNFLTQDLLEIDTSSWNYKTQDPVHNCIQNTFNYIQNTFNYIQNNFYSFLQPSTQATY